MLVFSPSSNLQVFAARWRNAPIAVSHLTALGAKRTCFRKYPNILDKIIGP
ncbi:hypothetical protein [Rhizobium tumorigenes]|uniref:Uncharacterized protein n=1 Tax=Rhizobium tumorigenes TaxID=2041385 RepID=A0AAF1KW40_9HYPH|nr:hypothetical protein [Rhizobium tumorigenes]WFR95769.1 hypothetical protein PR017_01045 [Rhizobium tumorigenes]